MIKGWPLVVTTNQTSYERDLVEDKCDSERLEFSDGTYDILT